MINFEDEIKKYKPMMEVKEAEEAIKNRDLTDMVDILKDITGNRNPMGDVYR